MLKILVADDHALIREALSLALANQIPDIQIIEAYDAGSVHDTLDQHRDVNVIVLDLHMPGSNGLELLKALCAAFPALPIVVLSAEEEVSVMRKCIERGAAGFIPKSTSREVIVAAIRLVLSGGTYIPPHLLSSSASDTDTQFSTVNPLADIRGLTHRQIDVLKLLAQGKTNKQIAKTLELSEYTVKTHMVAIFKALNVSNRTQAVVLMQSMPMDELGIS